MSTLIIVNELYDLSINDRILASYKYFKEEPIEGVVKNISKNEEKIKVKTNHREIIEISFHHYFIYKIPDNDFIDKVNESINDDDITSKNVKCDIPEWSFDDILEDSMYSSNINIDAIIHSIENDDTKEDITDLPAIHIETKDGKKIKMDLNGETIQMYNTESIGIIKKDAKRNNILSLL